MPVKYQIWRVDPVGVSLVGENRADAAVLSAEIVVEIKLIVPEYDRLVSKLTCTEPADDIRIDLVKLTEALRYLESCVDADVDFLRAGGLGSVVQLGKLGGICRLMPAHQLRSGQGR